MMRARRLRRAAAALAIGAVLWLGGLAWFVRLVPLEVADPDSVTDAIVVLTGGSLRVESGLRLLAAAKAKLLFVSGVHPGVSVPQLVREAPETSARTLCCIVLGHAAESTIGNARETAAFMAAHDFRSLRLVTASYHMPRSLLEFGRAMPQIRIVPNPVFPDPMRGAHWWLRPSSLWLVAGEYTKYLVALAVPFAP